MIRTCLYPLIFMSLSALVCVAAWYRYVYYKHPRYRYSSLRLLKRSSSLFHDKVPTLVPFFLYCIGLISLCCALARIQVIDEMSRLPVDGVDIMLTLDISGSMTFLDDPHDQRTRIAIAKQEAIQFVRKREHDSFGLVVFAHDVVTRCPLTSDKSMVTHIIQETDIGLIDHTSTLLCKALLAAAARLRHSTAKSKIIILLTDGEPSLGDTSPEDTIPVLKKLGIKVYTIGIGSSEGGYTQHPLLGLMRTQVCLNTALLEQIAKETGGTFFHAQKPGDVARIYGMIDRLEKTEHAIPVYTRVTELFVFFLALALICFLAEWILTSVWWVRL